MEDTIDPAVGFVILAKPGDRVDAGDILGTIHARNEDSLAEGERVLRNAIKIGGEPASSLELISLRITADDNAAWRKPGGEPRS